MSNEEVLNNVYIGFNLKVNNQISHSLFTNFILTNKIFDKVGLFDENIYPAYFEDNDYWKRILLSSEKFSEISDVNIFHVDKKGGCSASLNSVDYNYKTKMKVCYELNSKYFYEKWNTKEELLSNELAKDTFINPFNNINYNIKDFIEHSNFYGNQKILLNHCNKPQFKLKLYLNLDEEYLYSLNSLNSLIKFNKFNSKIYKYYNEELYNLDDNECIYHFLNYGIKENRIFKYNFEKNFDVNYYKLLNNDLKNMSNDEAELHYIKYGIYENRKYYYNFPNDFNIENYKKNNPECTIMNDYDVKLYYVKTII